MEHMESTWSLESELSFLSIFSITNRSKIRDNQTTNLQSSIDNTQLMVAHVLHQRPDKVNLFILGKLENFINAILASSTVIRS